MAEVNKRTRDRRLLKLAALLEADAKNKKGIKFDIRDWGTVSKQTPISCGTVACAMGLAALSGEFKRAGLKALLSHTTQDLVVLHAGHRDLAAAKSLFGITYEEAVYLFTSIYYPSTKQQGAAGERFVAKRIRNFVAGRRK